MKVLLVDDEPLARLELRRLLAHSPWVQIVGEAANIDEAQTKIRDLGPDLIFLDIRMPGGSGFDLLSRIERLPVVIFTTAFDNHAVKAFDVNALDYLLKPIEPERLAAALTKARTQMDKPETDTFLQRVFIRDGLRCWFVPLAEVSIIESEGNYIRLHWGKEKPLLLHSLKAFEQRLDPRRFYRASRQAVINLDLIEHTRPKEGGRLILQMCGGATAVMSRRQARDFRRFANAGF